LFRSNLRPLEYYHQYKDLDSFISGCHDFYLKQGIWFLENDKFDEVSVLRLTPKGQKDFEIEFDVSGKKFRQIFISNFNKCLNHPKPDITFFRGGFEEYCQLVKAHPKFFGLKLYLGASKRIYPAYGGKYDKILVESEIDLTHPNCFPFYKTANPNTFYPRDLEKIYDICWPCNFTQIRHKGQEYFISQVSKSKVLRKLSIIHFGNKPNVGENLAKKYKVNNIKFKGLVDRTTLNTYLNRSKFGLVTSNKIDGCPRISTEIMCSGTPLLIREETRLFPYYKEFGVFQFNENSVEMGFEIANSNYGHLCLGALKNVQEKLTYESICKKNLEIWNL